MKNYRSKFLPTRHKLQFQFRHATSLTGSASPEQASDHILRPELYSK